MDDPCSVQCGGRCCEDFPLNHAPGTIAELYAVALQRPEADRSRNDLDIITIAEMVIRIDEDDETSPRYTCKHLRNGLCSIYNNRPKMCSDYPGYGRGGACSHCSFVQPIPPSRQLPLFERKRA